LLLPFVKGSVLTSDAAILPVCVLGDWSNIHSACYFLSTKIPASGTQGARAKSFYSPQSFLSQPV
jgi:hypothetical protein